jgi:Fe-S-cluster containining protein
MQEESSQLLVGAAQAAIGRHGLIAGVEAIYRCADAATAARQPACRQCGRCCQFRRLGHRLFVSTAEAAFFLQSTSVLRVTGSFGGVCPFLREVPARCAARMARPLGCRLYYCDTATRRWQEGLYSRLHRRLQDLHQAVGVPYFYAEWLAVLRAAAAPPVAEGCPRKTTLPETISGGPVDRNPLPPYALNVRARRMAR